MKVKQTAIEFEPRIAKLFKQAHSTKIKLDLKKVILLDSQSTMDLICDPALVESTFKSSHSMRLKSNTNRTVNFKVEVNSFFGCAIAEVHAPIAAQGTGE
jgi:hypothetical protein